mmetsp:Transcript_23161/g.37782  ORF Transcript_23161/g.37782 Transcript_23161/m.37782 type:complete len:90 (-) Transcript_23161:1900-2169(-)
MGLNHAQHTQKSPTHKSGFSSLCYLLQISRESEEEVSCLTHGPPIKPLQTLVMRLFLIISAATFYLGRIDDLLPSSTNDAHEICLKKDF